MHPLGFWEGTDKPGIEILQQKIPSKLGSRRKEFPGNKLSQAGLPAPIHMAVRSPELQSPNQKALRAWPDLEEEELFCEQLVTEAHLELQNRGGSSRLLASTDGHFRGQSGVRKMAAVVCSDRMVKEEMCNSSFL